jgi:CubicO group peptidase (beta-lactamase class C family)
MVKSTTKLNRRKLVARTVMFLIIALTLIASANQSRLNRLYRAITLFEPAVIEENFRSIEQLFDARIVQKSAIVSQFEYDLKDLPDSYTYQGETKKISDFIERTQTSGLIIVRNDTILYEEYFRGNSDSTRTISWSVSKSIVSALLGIAVAEGSIEDLNQQVTDYLPSLKGSGYDGVKIIDVLQMSSGVRFNEDYSDFFSDINRMSRVFALNSPLEKFVASLESEREPGTYNKYVSMDTQVLGMVIIEATGKTLSEYMEDKLWQPAGMESDASWLIDSAGVEAAFGGLNAVLRDYARFGCLYLNMGYWNGKQILPPAWVADSVTPNAPHLMPGNNPDSEWVLGYGYQWWIPENPDGDYLAIGIYGQAIYIYPRYNIVIAKTSAYSGYDDDGEEMELESIEFFRAIAREIPE